MLARSDFKIKIKSFQLANQSEVPMEAIRNHLQSNTLPLFPFEFPTQEKAAEFKHDWITNPNFFIEQDARFALCNPLLLPSESLDEIREQLENELLDNRGALMSVFYMCAGWCRVTNQVYETAHYDYRALADRLGMAESTMRRWFLWGVEKGLWRTVPGGGIEFLPTFLKYSRVSREAEGILRSRGRSYAQTLKEQISKLASRVHLPTLNSVGSRELVLERPESPPSACLLCAY